MKYLFEDNSIDSTNEFVPNLFDILFSMNSILNDGDKCKVITGTHVGKTGNVKDINISKTGALTITVVQENGERFKTLAKNVILIN